MTPIIEIKDLSAGYNGKTIIENISLTVFENDFLGIIGPNGGGKTTLLRTILGLLKSYKGTISFFDNGVPCDNITIGYLPQYSKIDKEFPISVYEVVLSGLSKNKPLFRSYTKEQHEQVKQTLEEMQLMPFAQRPIEALSGGQLQRVLLARAIVSKPKLLVLDEPNTYIDRRFQDQMYEMLNNINKHCAIVMTNHDIGTILQNVKNIACMNKHLHYHSNTEVPEDWIEEHFGCPIEMVAHGDIPHRVLKNHK
ncbi:metal ABC transporter ATP-binding protein [Hoylesella nanceiensis]|uniref:metal ABC transporter ATP-binding protein n=1 Tax=Hoylesella nanceiensis TaxID=425941 RepID=UPI0024A87D25|nr:metal ABC transporter ATP-binding protein [Hoylesella nanceiensis]